MTNSEIIDKIRRGEIDINNQSSFFGTLIKGLLWNLNQQIQLRKKNIPHYIINTGDETIFTGIKGADETADPTNIENENYIYTKIPRCAVSPKGITLSEDQCTSPYALGSCQYEDDDNLFTLTGEFRRLSLTMSFDLEYLVDSYTDYLSLCQQIISKMAFIRVFDIVYMGQKIPCSYKIPDSLEGDYSVDFDLDTTDDKRKKISISIEVETVYPIFDPATMMAADNYIKNICTHKSVVSYPTLPDGSSEGDSLSQTQSYSSQMSVYSKGGIENNGPWEDPNK